jgi:hypothetical protein
MKYSPYFIIANDKYGECGGRMCLCIVICNEELFLFEEEEDEALDVWFHLYKVNNLGEIEFQETVDKFQYDRPATKAEIMKAGIWDKIKNKQQENELTVYSCLEDELEEYQRIGEEIEKESSR